MTLHELRSAIQNNADANVSILLPGGERLPAHFHVTEVGKVTKLFVDCGGTRREQVTCVFQTFVANDIDHRLSGSTLKSILDAGDVLGLDPALPVEFEVQLESVAIFPVSAVGREKECLEIQLGTKSTACLAPDKCGIEVVALDLGKS